MKSGDVCFYINNGWCLDVLVVSIELLMVKCRPFYLPREFSAVCLGLLHDVISKHETEHLDAVFVAVEDFNHHNLKRLLRKYHQGKQHSGCLQQREGSPPGCAHARLWTVQPHLSDPPPSVQTTPQASTPSNSGGWSRFFFGRARQSVLVNIPVGFNEKKNK